MLSVIIPTWNGLRYLPQCFTALVPQLPPGSEIVLVDNASTDGTEVWVAAHYPAVRIVALPINIGFAGGVAAGLRAARGDFLLLLNNDAFVESGCIAALLDALENEPAWGAVGGVLTFAHRPELVASAGIRVLRNGLALDLWPGVPVAELPSAPVEILGPSGAAALYRRVLLADVGLTEPDFFAYLEDVDLALRARLRGWRSAVVPAARARHVYSATGGHGSPFKQRLLGRNRARVLVRCLPHQLLLRYLPAILVYDMLAVLYGLLTRQPAVLAGRVAALGELPVLLAQRKKLVSEQIVPAAALEQWFEPAGAPWSAQREAKHLAAILRERDLTATQI